MKLEIDAREPKELINLIKNNIPDNFPLEITNLDLGDFIIKDDNDSDKVLLIFERKSLTDLMASIKDGRYREQSFRLNEFPIHNHNIYYLIEGDLNKYIFKNAEVNKKILTSAIASLSHFKGFSVIRTQSISETGVIVCGFIRKLLNEKKQGYYQFEKNSGDKNTEQDEQEQDEKDQDISPLTYSETLKTAKKSNITIENIGEIMLSQIPGVSITVAGNYEEIQ